MAIKGATSDIKQGAFLLIEMAKKKDNLPGGGKFTPPPKIFYKIRHFI